MTDQEVANDAKHLIFFIKASMTVLSHRVMTMMAMTIGAGLAVYAASQPDLYRTVVAVLWFPLVYFPALWAERKSNGEGT